MLPRRVETKRQVLIKRVHKQKHAYSFITGGSDKNECVLDVSQGCGEGKESFDKAAAAARQEGQHDRVSHWALHTAPGKKSVSLCVGAAFNNAKQFDHQSLEGAGCCIAYIKCQVGPRCCCCCWWWWWWWWWFGWLHVVWWVICHAMLMSIAPSFRLVSEEVSWAGSRVQSPRGVLWHWRWHVWGSANEIKIACHVGPNCAFIAKVANHKDLGYMFVWLCPDFHDMFVSRYVCSLVRT